MHHIDEMKQMILNSACNMVFDSFCEKDSFSYFCGYYYPAPLHDNKLICHRTDFDGRDVAVGDTCDIGYWDLDKQSFVECAQTRAFNWQQGAMLQWLPDGKIIFNQRQDNHFVSVIHDPDRSSATTIPYSIYAVHPSGKFALAANFEHLAFCRSGYNYQGILNKRWDVFIDPDDGIFHVDLESGHVRLLVSTAQIAAMKPRADMNGCYHWLEHIIWNPSGDRFAFLHRWAPGDSSGVKHRTRLLTADMHGEDIFLFPDVGFYSHMNWGGDRKLTVWSAKPEQGWRSMVLPGSRLRRLLKPAYHAVKKFLPQALNNEVEAFQAFIEYTDKSNEYEVIGEGLLKRNGHNTWTADGRYMLTDTYEDAHRWRHLLLYDSSCNKVTEIGKFYSPFNRSAFRCDLHPRFDDTQTRVVIDSAHKGRRNVYVIDIKKLL